MAFYFSSETMAFYDTDVFPVASLPANKVEVNEADYTDLMQKQNQGYVIKADNSGNPYAVAQGEAPATDMKHSGSVATTIALGHVKIGSTMQTDQNGVLDVKDGVITNGKIADGSVTTAKLADGAVTTSKIENGSVTEDKLDAVKDLCADESTLTMAEDSNGFTMSVKDGGIGESKIASNAVGSDKIWDGGVTTNKIAPFAVTEGKLRADAVTTDKIADGAVTGAKLAPESVTQTKIMNRQVTSVKLAEDACTSVLSFQNSNGDNLNGTTQRLQYSGEPVEIGRTQLITVGDIVDFTIAFDWGDVLDPIANIKFKLIVWTGSDVGHATDKFERTVSTSQVHGDNYALHCQERFSFRQGAAASSRVHVSIDLINSPTWMKLVNIQMNGIRSPGY